VETKFLHDSQNEILLNFIKSFFHIHVEKHEATFSFFEFVGVLEFMSKYDVVLDISRKYKGRLERGDDLGED
jgi:hypothetical protein